MAEKKYSLKNIKHVRGAYNAARELVVHANAAHPDDKRLKKLADTIVGQMEWGVHKEALLTPVHGKHVTAQTNWGNDNFLGAGG